MNPNETIPEWPGKGLDATRRSSLEDVLTTCETDIEQLTKALYSIKERLGPILRPEPTTDSNPGPVESTSPAVDRMRAIDSEISRSVDRIHCLCGLLDL